MCSWNFPGDISVRENCSSGCRAMRMCVGYPCYVPVSTLNIQMWLALSLVHALKSINIGSYVASVVVVVDKATFNRFWLLHVEKNFRFRWFMSDTIKGWICEIPKLSWASLPSAKTCDADSVFNAGKILPVLPIVSIRRINSKDAPIQCRQQPNDFVDISHMRMSDDSFDRSLNCNCNYQ